jgi:peptidyl-prolyl cis-trans isomerase SurA
MPTPRPAPLARLAAAALLALGLALPATAQQGGPFAARLYVNDRAVTNYEFDQRVRMLTLFRAPGDIQDLARTGLIEDRLRMQAAADLGLAAPPAAIRAGMEEFASRANLTADEFIKALAQGGVSEETFRDFVEAGLLWREVVRQRFADQVTVTEAEIDRAIAAAATAVETRVQLSEIVIAGDAAAATALLSRLRAGIRSEADFATAAQQNSAARTAADGGRLDWRNIDDLPPDIAAALRDLRPGGITQPVPVPGGVAIYLVRGLDAQPVPGQAASVTVDFARLILRPDRPAAEEAARIRAGVDTCDDLYEYALGQPDEVLVREAMAPGKVPADLADDLARLDPGETALVTRGGAAQLLMLCSRGPGEAVAPARDLVENDLQNRRLGALAEIYLEELRQAAILREP